MFKAFKQQNKECFKTCVENRSTRFCAARVIKFTDIALEVDLNGIITGRVSSPKKTMSYNKLLTNLACSSRTREYWPSVVFVRTSGQYSPVRPSRSVSKRLIFPNFQNRGCCEKYLKDSKHKSLHLERKYPRIFVCGRYLFLEANSFSRAALSENNFAPNRGYC